jgi:hypothetical protein
MVVWQNLQLSIFLEPISIPRYPEVGEIGDALSVLLPYCQKSSQFPCHSQMKQIDGLVEEQE